MAFSIYHFNIYVEGINYATFYDFSIWFRNYSDYVAFFFGILFFFLLQYILHLYLGIFLITCSHIFCCSIVNASNIEYNVLQISFNSIHELMGIYYILDSPMKGQETSDISCFPLPVLYCSPLLFCENGSTCIYFILEFNCHIMNRKIYLFLYTNFAFILVY